MDPMTMMALATILTPLIQKGVSSIGGGNEGMQKYPTMSKQQQQLHKGRVSQAQQMQGPGGGYQNALGMLQDMLNPQSDIYKNFEAPYRREFEEQTIPQLAERFAGMGAQGGALSSSGFGQALGAAGAGLQEKLAYLKSNLRQSAIERLMDQYNRLAEGSLNQPEFAYGNVQGGGSPVTAGATSAIQNMTPGGWESIVNLFQGGGSKYPLTSGYDQEFRQNPAAMGF